MQTQQLVYQKSSSAAVVVAEAMPSLVDLDAQPRVSCTTASSFGPSQNIVGPLPSALPFVPSCQFNTEVQQYTRIALQEPACAGCGLPINERYLLKVADDFWHENCLVCYYCGTQLASKPSCFVRDGRVYCRDDYKVVYSAKCGRCTQALLPSDMVYRCLGSAFHLACFSCLYCGQRLQKGDHYLIVEGQIVCRHDYELFRNPFAHGYYDPESGESSRKLPKRPRTILNSSQRRAFKASFEQSAKPCRKVREALAKETSLSVRVVQVWFQNQRAKMKKMQRKHELQQLHDSRKSAAADGASNGSGSGDAKKSSDNDKIEQASSPDNDDSDVDGEVENVASDDNDGADDAQPNPIDKLYSMQEAYFL